MAKTRYQLEGNAPQLYERETVHTLGRPLAEGMFAHVSLHAGERVLDAARGTGIVTRVAINPYLTLRDALGTIFQDADFAALFPLEGQPGLPPWRLALVTIRQFRENLTDLQAAESVWARIDWQYLLGPE